MQQNTSIERRGDVVRLTRRRGAAVLFCEAATEELAAEWLDASSRWPALMELPESVRVGRTSSKALRLERSAPLSFDYHWPREAARYVLRGTTGLRFDAGMNTRAQMAFEGEWDLAVERKGGRFAVELLKARSQGVAATLNARVDLELENENPPHRADPLLATLAGLHPMAWVRRMLCGAGSLEWKALARESGVRTHNLAALKFKWRHLTARSEVVLWRCLASPETLDHLRRLVKAIASGLPFNVPEDSPASEWIESFPPELLQPASADMSLWLEHDRQREGALKLRQFAEKAMNTANPTIWAAAAASEQFYEEAPQAPVETVVERWRGLRDRVISKSLEILKREAEAEVAAGLSRSSFSASLLSVSIPANESGLDVLAKLASGDLNPAFEGKAGAVIEHGLLKSLTRRRRCLSLQLPFAGRKQYRHELDTLASAEVSSDGPGRLVVYTLHYSDTLKLPGIAASSLILSAAVSARDGEPSIDNIGLGFEQTFEIGSEPKHAAVRRLLSLYGLRPSLPNGARAEMKLSVSVPGEIVAAWAQSPHPSTPEFHSAIHRIAARSQILMRHWIPALHFADPGNYADLGSAWPLILYSATEPHIATGDRDYTYDVMDRESVVSAANSALPALPDAIAIGREVLIEAGMRARARNYDPLAPMSLIYDSLRRPQFSSLLSSDAFLVADMLRLIETGRELRFLWERDPRMVVRRLERDGNYFVTTFHKRMRRLYGGSSVLALGPLILAETTAALSGEHHRCTARLEWTGGDGAKHVLTN